MTDEELHVAAAGYATRRKDAYVVKMKKGEVPKVSNDELQSLWLAHYEGYREGFWVATKDARFSTDPAKENT